MCSGTSTCSASSDRIPSAQRVGDLFRDSSHGELLSSLGKRGMSLFHKCFDNGLLVRATGDIIALSPPLILEKAHIDEMIGRIGELVETVD